MQVVSSELGQDLQASVPPGRVEIRSGSGILSLRLRFPLSPSSCCVCVWSGWEGVWEGLWSGTSAVIPACVFTWQPARRFPSTSVSQDSSKEGAWPPTRTLSNLPQGPTKTPPHALWFFAHILKYSRQKTNTCSTLALDLCVTRGGRVTFDPRCSRTTLSDTRGEGRWIARVRMCAASPAVILYVCFERPIKVFRHVL